MLWVLKRTVSMRRFFEHTKHMFKLMGKEINAILSAQTILIWTYEFGNKNVRMPLGPTAIFHPQYSHSAQIVAACLRIIMYGPRTFWLPPSCLYTHNFDIYYLHLQYAAIIG